MAAVAIDPEYLAVVAAHLTALSQLPLHPVGEIAGRRERLEKVFEMGFSTWPAVDDVDESRHVVKSEDGDYDIQLFGKS